MPLSLSLSVVEDIKVDVIEATFVVEEADDRAAAFVTTDGHEEDDVDTCKYCEQKLNFFRFL